MRYKLVEWKPVTGKKKRQRNVGRLITLAGCIMPFFAFSQIKNDGSGAVVLLLLFLGIGMMVAGIVVMLKTNRDDPEDIQAILEQRRPHCPGCGALLRPGAGFCTSCGRPVQKT